MGKKDNILSSLKRNKKAIKFDELIRLLKKNGYVERNVTGSHHVYNKQGYLPVLIVKPHGGKKFCHPKDVTKVIKILEITDDRQ